MAEYGFHILEKDVDGKIWYAGSFPSKDARDQHLLTQKRRCYPDKVFAPFDFAGVEACMVRIREINIKNGIKYPIDPPADEASPSTAGVQSV